MPIHLHEDPDLFKEALNFTEARTGFIARLIEKDYFCSVFLEHISALPNMPLIFKGGTCLAKVHATFYRLSEDLDFVIPMSVGASRRSRSEKMTSIKHDFEVLPEQLPCFHIIDELSGSNSSRQYIGTIGYQSLISNQIDTIKIEIGLREPQLQETYAGEAETILLNPITGKPQTPKVHLPCFSLKEAMAEKLRAALSRREVAIRDFYDIDYVVRHLNFQTNTPEFIELVRQKLSVPGNNSVQITPDRLTELHQQLITRLKPVLRDQDFTDFALDRAFQIVQQIARVL